VFLGFSQFLAFVFINTPLISYIEKDQVESYKLNMNKFAQSHQNPSSGLFLEPTIDANYRAIDSINFSSPEYQSSNLIDPLQNNYTNASLNFFLDYLFEKQNPDGSFSDVGGLGDMYSTFQVISTIDMLNSSYINPIVHEEKIDRIIDFVNMKDITMLDNYEDIGKISIPIYPVKKRMKELFDGDEKITIKKTDESIIFDGKRKHMEIKLFAEGGKILDISDVALTRYGLIYKKVAENNYQIAKTNVNELRSLKPEDNLLFNFDSDKVIIKVEDDNGTYTKKILTDDIFNFLDNNEEVNGSVSFSSTYFPKIISGIDGEVLLFLKEGYPLLIIKKAESYSVTYTVAPMIENA